MKYVDRKSLPNARTDRRRPAWHWLLFASFCAFSWQSSSAAAPFSFDDITYWVGSGSNRAALTIDWADNSTAPPALVWGYRWDGVKHGNDMLSAIIAADPRLFAKLGGSPGSPIAVYGLGYDANSNGQFGINDDTAFDSQGFAYTDPSDLATATDSGDYYAEGWFAGFWHYGVAAADPYNGGSWSDTSVGMAARTLTDGSWDSWTFSPTFNFSAYAMNPAAAAPPLSGDFNHDGRVNQADYEVWRSSFGSTSDLAADANGNSIVDAADYVAWRRGFAANDFASGSLANNIPEPTTALLIASFMVQFLIRRKKKVHAEAQRRGEAGKQRKFSASPAPLREISAYQTVWRTHS